MRVKRRWWQRGLAVAAIAAAGVCGWSEVGRTQPAPLPSNAGPAADAAVDMPLDRITGPFAVTKVVDGDTIWVDRQGTREKIRLIGVDTPETVDRRKGVQCFGIAASDHTKQVLTGQSVFLESDPSQSSTDRYGRELAYVWLQDGSLVNLGLIAQGFAHEYTYDVPYRYRDQFQAAEADARTHQRGLWSPTTCAGVTDSGSR